MSAASQPLWNSALVSVICYLIAVLKPAPQIVTAAPSKKYCIVPHENSAVRCLPVPDTKAPSRSFSAVHLLHQLRPAVDDRHPCVRLVGREHRHDARDAEVLKSL